MESEARFLFVSNSVAWICMGVLTRILAFYLGMAEIAELEVIL